MDWIPRRKEEEFFKIGGPSRKKVGPLGADLKKLGTSQLWPCSSDFGVTANVGSLSQSLFFLLYIL